MKKVLALVLAIVLIFTLFGCDENNSSNNTSSTVSAIISPDEITAETISFLGVLNNCEWQSGEDIDTLSYLSWYRDFTNTSIDLDWKQNFVFPMADFEECVQKYFDVSTEHLRDSEYFNSEEKVYSFDENGKFKYRVNLSKENAVQIQGDIAYVKVELPLQGDFADTEYRLYTLKKVDDGFKYLSCEDIMSSDVSNAVQNVEDILSDFGGDMLIGYSFETTKEIPDDDLVMWYGYRLKSQGKSANAAEGLDHPFYPAEEFEREVYNYFGIESDHLRNNINYSQKYNGYALPAAPMGAAHHFYEITDTEVENNIYKISFLLRIANKDPYTCVLTAQKTDNGFRFISYINQKPEIKFK